MRWTAKIRVLFSKFKCFVAILVSLCIFFLFASSNRLSLSKVGKISSWGRKVSISDAVVEDSLSSDRLTPVPQLLKLSTTKTDFEVEDFPAVLSSTSLSPSSHPTASLVHRVDFDPHGKDVLVILHTQKTGGSEFLRHLITVKRNGVFLCSFPSSVLASIEKNNKVPKNIRRSKRGGRGKRVKRRATNNPTSCPRDPAQPDGDQWLVAEKTMGWVCGLHATLTEYKACVPNLAGPRFTFKDDLRLNFAILLRHPVLRYLSEYLHVQRNATWSSRHMCGGKAISIKDMPPCYPGYYQGKPWPNLTLSSFVSCESNWGNNRQTRMLANLEEVHCFDRSAMSWEERDRRLLESAKTNLKSIAFFGLTEYLPESCRLFEETFGVKFAVLPEQRSVSEIHSAPMLTDLWTSTNLYRAILQANHLDVQLYEFALGLFSERAQAMGLAVNRDLVEQSVDSIRSNPHQINRALEKFKKMNFKVS